MLAFPGLFKGTLDADVTKITHQMKIAVSETLSALAKNGALVPASLNKDAHNKVAEAVYQAAIKQKNEYL